ncbi:MAG TPA: hypothetical protein VL501_03870 [Pyrinomonadaceae bacterium]|nr:hypothetical protein [Pyrinomonadaceae bacterium]
MLLKRYTFWLAAAVLFMFLTAGLHSISFFVSPDIQNETQRQLHDLLHTYREDMGGGFHRTFFDLFTALSACYPLLCVLGGATLGFMMLKHAEPRYMRGLIAINLAVFGVCLVVMIVFAFLPPIIVTGLIAFNLLMALAFCPKTKEAATELH